MMMMMIIIQIQIQILRLRPNDECPSYTHLPQRIHIASQRTYVLRLKEQSQVTHYYIGLIQNSR